MKNLISILLLLIINEVLYCQNWEKLGDLPYSFRYDDVYFHDKDLGWTCNGGGEIYKTTNGGETWELKYERKTDYLRAINFLDETIGVASSLDSILLRTIDGGETWSELDTDFMIDFPGACGISHYGDSFFVVGKWNTPAFFIRSRDKGLTWDYENLARQADALVDCHFINDDIGFVCGRKNNVGGVILKTTDGGDTWTEVLNTNEGSEYVWKLFFVNEQIVYGAIESFMGETTRMTKSMDGGNSWEVLFVDDRFLDVQGIGFINQDTGWVSPRGEAMFETHDGGQTWEQKGNLDNINRFFVRPDKKLVASGHSLFILNDLEVTSNDFAPSRRFHNISSVLPNPTEGFVTAEIQIDVKTFVKLEIYDLEGQLIHSIFNGKIQPGNHQFEINLLDRNLSAGTYFLVLRTNEGFFHKKIQKI